MDICKKNGSKPVIRGHLGLGYYFNLSEDTPSLH